MFDLIVTQAFGAYAVGDRITDAEEAKAALASHGAHVVRVSHVEPAADPGQPPAAPILTPPPPVAVTEPEPDEHPDDDPA